MSQMIRFDVKKLLEEQGLTLKSSISGNEFEVLFEDNEVLVMSDADIVLDRYFLEIFNHIDLPVLSKYSIVNFVGPDRIFTSDTHKKFFSVVYKDYIHHSLIPKKKLTFKRMSESWKEMFQILNNIYSELQYHIIEYGVSLNILDFHDMSKDEELMKIIDAGVKDNKNPNHIETTNKRLAQLLKDNPHNNLAKLYNSGAANKTQISHTLGRRGFVTDINNNIYPEAVDTNLVEGINSPYGMACESAVMAKALKLQQFGVRYSEWLQRELHMLGMVLKQLTLDDCGAGEDIENYTDFYVKDEKEFENLLGVNFLYNGKEVELDWCHKDDVVRTEIKMRPIYNCRHIRHGKLCMKCLGALAYSIPGFANLGHTLITMVMAMIGQLMLSAKHYTDSTKLKKLILDAISSLYFKVVNESTLTLNEKIQKHKGKVFIILEEKAYYGFRLLSSKMLDSLKKMDTSKLSKIERLWVVLEDEHGHSTKEFVQIKQDGRSGILDMELIEHSINNKTAISGSDYIIDVTKYKGNILFLESKEFAFDVFNTEFKTLLTSVGASKVQITPDEFTSKVFNFLSTKLNVNIKIVEILVTALTLEDKNNEDYRVGLNKETRTVSAYAKAISGKTPGVSFGFEKQKNILSNPNTFLNNDKHEYNPLENVFMIKNIRVNRVEEY